MSRDAALLLALGALTAAALTVGCSGWALVLRSRPARASFEAGSEHAEVHGER